MAITLALLPRRHGHAHPATLGLFSPPKKNYAPLFLLKEKTIQKHTFFFLAPLKLSLKKNDSRGLDRKLWNFILKGMHQAINLLFDILPLYHCLTNVNGNNPVLKRKTL